MDRKTIIVVVHCKIEEKPFRVLRNNLLCRSGSFIVVLSEKLHPRWQSSANTLWLTHSVSPSKFKLEVNNGKLDILAIAFLRCARCNKDQLYLLEIANSHGPIGEQLSAWRYRELAEIFT